MGIFKRIWSGKGSRVWFIITASLLVLLLTANIVATQSLFIYNTINSIFGGERRVLVSGDPSQYQYYQGDYDSKDSVLNAANLLNEKIVEEGIVLLKNEDNALPIATPNSDSAVNSRPKISVFGKNSVNFVYGGSGSGGSNSAGATTIHESLSAAGFDVNPKLKDFYNNNSLSGKGRPQSPSMGDILSGFETGETPVTSYTGDVKASYSAYNDAALIVISRIGGEGFDLPRSMKTNFSDKATAINGARNKDDHYLQLDQNETNLIKEVALDFDKIIIIINCSQAMELGFLDDTGHYAYSNKIKAALWVGGTGKTGLNALGRVLNGSVNPSGRTVDTYARNFALDPSWSNFSNNIADNGNRYAVEGKNKQYYFVEYEEGIYVGYRYYETRGYTEQLKSNAGWYNDNVVYPLGYGLSYTDFSWEIVNAAEIASTVINAETILNVKVRVTNTGSVAGKDVVELYVTAPYSVGGIEKAHKVLVGFEKTPLLYPSAQADATKPNSHIAEISVPAYYFASYDYNDANDNDFSGYEIEQGNYDLHVSRDSHNAESTVTCNVAQNISMRNDTTTDNTVENRFNDVSSYIKKYLSRDDWDGTWPAAPASDDKNVDKSFIDSLAYSVDDNGAKWYTDEMPKQSKKVLKYDKTEVKLYDLIGKDYDDELWDELLDQLTVDQLRRLIGTGNYNTASIENIAKLETIDPDGPVGFTSFMGSPIVYETCFYASGCVVGATYNKELAEEMGKMVGNEGIIGNKKGDGAPYSGWYAPAVNIHRSPFGGRNWEYYSEDGFLSGAMASYVVKGAKSKGVYTYVKHFALNDQETDRTSNGILTWANEQSMRELYFRAFEITVKDGKTTAMMSSFNRIGKTWAGGSYELLTEVLRNEWGFRGMVITDYNLYAHMPADQMIRAGGDLNLCQEKMPSKTNTATHVSAIRTAGKNILYTVANSNAMNGLGENVRYKFKMPVWVGWLLMADAAVVVALGVWGFFAVKKTIKRTRKKSEDFQK